MRIALIRPLQEGVELEFQEPLGLLCLAGHLRREGFDVRVFDRRLSLRLGENIYENLRAYAPSLIGFSLTTEEDVPDTRRLLQLFKAPGIRFALGGLYITTAYARAKEQFPRDVHFILGEGELPLAAYARGSDGGVPDGTPAELLAPDDWAEAARDDLEAYLRYGCCVNLRTARGCPGSCTFCATPRLPVHKWAGRSVALVADEMTRLLHRAQALGITPAFNLVDDDFGTLERAEALCAALAARNFRAGFSVQLRARVIYEAANLTSRAKSLHEGGLCRIFVGLESINPETLRRWGKALDPFRFLDILPILRDAGIETHVGYILWHRDATPESVRYEMETLHCFGIFSPKTALSRLVLFPGSALYESYGLTDGAVWEPLPPAMERAYTQLAEGLSPLYEIWVRGAIWLPGLACAAYATQNLTTLNAANVVMTRINDITYSFVMGERIDTRRTADEVEGMLCALGCPGL